MTGAWSLPARNGLPAALAGGTLHPPAPAVCLLDGLPPRPCAVKAAAVLAALRSSRPCGMACGQP